MSHSIARFYLVKMVENKIKWSWPPSPPDFDFVRFVFVFVVFISTILLSGYSMHLIWFPRSIFTHTHTNTKYKINETKDNHKMQCELLISVLFFFIRFVSPFIDCTQKFQNYFFRRFHTMSCFFPDRQMKNWLQYKYKYKHKHTRGIFVQWIKLISTLTSSSSSLLLWYMCAPKWTKYNPNHQRKKNSINREKSEIRDRGKHNSK